MRGSSNQPVDKDVIARKLDSLGRCIARIEAKRPATFEALAADLDCQDIISINLERAVQLCVDIGAHLLCDVAVSPPETMGDVFTALSTEGILDPSVANALRRAVGFRNLSVHAYANIDWQRVFDIIQHRLDDFRTFARCVTARAGL